MARWPLVVFACFLLTGLAGAPVAAGNGAAAAAGLSITQQFDRAEFRIAVFPNGSARWTFRYERTLANETERRQFERFAETFNSNETRLFTDFRNQSQTLVEQGASSTGREMTARSFDRRAFVTTQLNEAGVVAMAFTWTGFARTDGQRIIVGDVFEGGLYLGPEQVLVVRSGADLRFQSVEPTGTLSNGSLGASDTVTWTGERTFTDNRPRVVLVPSQPVATTSSISVYESADVTTTSTGSSSGPLWPVAVVAVVILFTLGTFLYRRHRRQMAGPSHESTQSASTPSLDEAALIDDEARIEGLLEEHGGRMRQSGLVEATGWSKSKVSMVLSEMEDANRIRKLQVGRENIVSLPGHEPDAVASPHDDGDEGGKS